MLLDDAIINLRFASVLGKSDALLDIIVEFSKHWVSRDFFIVLLPGSLLKISFNCGTIGYFFVKFFGFFNLIKILLWLLLIHIVGPKFLKEISLRCDFYVWVFSLLIQLEIWSIHLLLFSPGFFKQAFTVFSNSFSGCSDLWFFPSRLINWLADLLLRNLMGISLVMFFWFLNFCWR